MQRKGTLRATGAHEVMVSYGQSMTRAGAIYAVGMMAVFPVALLSVAITTRYLEPPDYGRLAILLPWRPCSRSSAAWASSKAR